VVAARQEARDIVLFLFQDRPGAVIAHAERIAVT
jgi:hypothetical protein